MLSGTSFCSASFSYKINYKIESSIYNHLEKQLFNGKSIRLLTFLGFTAASITNLITRTTAIFEVTIHSLGMILTTPFAKKPMTHFKVGCSLLKEIPYNILRDLFLVIELPYNAIWTMSTLDGFIVNNAEHMTTNLKHSEAGTIGSEQHSIDLDIATGRAHHKFVELHNKKTNNPA